MRLLNSEKKLIKSKNGQKKKKIRNTYRPGSPTTGK